MALRFVRLLIPSGASAFRAGSQVPTAKIHSGVPNNLRYGWWAYILGERTTPRFNQNSRIITVDGNLASGKGALAQKLADSLGMLYVSEPDIHYLDKMTGEKENLDIQFGGNCSLEKFYTDPKSPDGNSYRLQSWMYHVRLLHYADAIEHLLTTGQGVIMERSPYSDMVFLDAMAKQGYIRKQCVEHYNEIKNISICEFLPPHLVVYLDVPAEEVQKKLKQSSEVLDGISVVKERCIALLKTVGRAYLQNIPLAYLKGIEDAYKKTFLPKMRDHCEVLAYDAVQAQDIEKVVEDIESLKLEKGPWPAQDDVSFHHLRILVEDKQRVASLTTTPQFLPEVTVGAHEYDQTYYAYKSLPGKQYAPGYNEDVGDKNIWLK